MTDFYKDGFYWSPTNVQRPSNTYETAPAGYEQQFQMVAAGLPWEKVIVTTDASGLNIANGPAILGGIYPTTAGTMAAVYDNATATGDVVIPSSTAKFIIENGGVLCPLGITCDWTSGVWVVLFRRAT